MWFKLLKGRHIQSEHGKDVAYRRGDVIESDRRLDRLFPNKFERVSGRRAVGRKRVTAGKTSDAGRASESPSDKVSGRNVTGQFAKARNNDLTVYRAGARYTVLADGQEVYSGDTKKAFVAWLNKYAEV